MNFNFRNLSISLVTLVLFFLGCGDNEKVELLSNNDVIDAIKNANWAGKISNARFIPIAPHYDLSTRTYSSELTFFINKIYKGKSLTTATITSSSGSSSQESIEQYTVGSWVNIPMSWDDRFHEGLITYKLFLNAPDGTITNTISTAIDLNSVESVGDETVISNLYIDPSQVEIGNSATQEIINISVFAYVKKIKRGQRIVSMHLKGSSNSYQSILEAELSEVPGWISSTFTINVYEGVNRFQCSIEMTDSSFSNSSTVDIKVTVTPPVVP